MVIFFDPIVIKAFPEQWPWLQLNFTFQSAQWQWALVAVYLPSLLLFCCALLAQWKRRKVQVMVSLGALLAVLFIVVTFLN